MFFSVQSVVPFFLKTTDLRSKCNVMICWRKKCGVRVRGFTADAVCVKEIKEFNHNAARCSQVHRLLQTELANQQLAVGWRFNSPADKLYDWRNVKVRAPKHRSCPTLFCYYSQKCVCRICLFIAYCIIWTLTVAGMKYFVDEPLVNVLTWEETKPGSSEMYIFMKPTGKIR